MNARRLYRCRENRQIAGVAAGMAEYLEVDPTIIRIAWILSAFFGGFTILLYIILAFVIPLEPIVMPAAATPASPAVGPDGATPEPDASTAAGGPTASPPWAHVAQPAFGPGAPAAHVHERRDTDRRPGQAGLVFGVLFITFGAIALAGPIFPGWVAGHALGPAFVLALGVALLVGAVRRPAAGA